MPNDPREVVQRRHPASPPAATDPRTSGAVVQMRALAWFLDASVRVPFTRFRIGVDSLVGLVPDIGDALGAAASSLILFQAWRLGVPAWTLVRMLANVALESIVGLVPIVGDVFDMAFKANLRNVELATIHVEGAAEAETRGRRAARRWLIGIGVAVVTMILLGIAVFVWLLVLVLP